jgi:hypothetical protein
MQPEQQGPASTSSSSNSNDVLVMVTRGACDVSTAFSLDGSDDGEPKVMQGTKSIVF